MTRTESGRADECAPAQSRQGRARHVSEVYDRTLEQCRQTQAAFKRLSQAGGEQPDGRERIEFLAHLRAFHESNLELHETLGGAETGQRRAMHEAFGLARETYLKAQAALTEARQARDRGEDDGPERSAFHAHVRAYHRLTRAARELAVGVEPSCRGGSLTRINEALRDWHED